MPQPDSVNARLDKASINLVQWEVSLPVAGQIATR